MLESPYEQFKLQDSEHFRRILLVNEPLANAEITDIVQANVRSVVNLLNKG